MNKKRGSDAERELLHLLSSRGFAVARVAGSGMMEETDCDLFAGNSKKKYAIEVKLSSEKKKYLRNEQISGLVEFAEKFGLSPIIAIKFLRQGWWFIEPEKLDKTDKALAISLEDIKKRGKSFEEITKN